MAVLCKAKAISADLFVRRYVPYFDVTALVRLAERGAVSCKAIVLELYGTGNAPQNDPRLLSVSFCEHI